MTAFSLFVETGYKDKMSFSVFSQLLFLYVSSVVAASPRSRLALHISNSCGARGRSTVSIGRRPAARSYRYGAGLRCVPVADADENNVIIGVAAHSGRRRLVVLGPRRRRPSSTGRRGTDRRSRSVATRSVVIATWSVTG